MALVFLTLSNRLAFVKPLSCGIFRWYQAISMLLVFVIVFTSLAVLAPLTYALGTPFASTTWVRQAISTPLLNTFMTQSMFLVYYPFKLFLKVIIVSPLCSLLAATTLFFPTAMLTAQTTSFGVLFTKSSGRFAAYMIISRAYQVGTTLAAAAAGIFLVVRAFVQPIAILAYVGFVVAYSTKASRMASFTCLIIAGALSLVTIVAWPSSSYYLASASLHIARISQDSTLGSYPKGSQTLKLVRIPYIFNQRLFLSY